MPVYARRHCRSNPRRRARATTQPTRLPSVQLVSRSIGENVHRLIVPVLTLALGLLAGCGAVEDKVEDAKLAVGSPSYISRCVDLMHRALPDTDFNVTDQHSSTTMTTSVVTVQAARPDVAANSGMHDVAAECHFDHGVIVDFHWTKNPLGEPS